MKFLARASIVLALLTPTFLFAAERGNMVLVNAGMVPFGLYEASFEKKLDKAFSISTSASYYESRKVLLARLASKGYGFFLGFSPKFHLHGEAHEHSFYLAPHFKAGYMNHPTVKTPDDIKESILLRVGANFGFAHVFQNGLGLDLSMGLEYYHNVYRFDQAASDLQKPKDTGGMFRPIMAFSIGYAF